MNVEIRKITQYKSEYRITRADSSEELIELDTKTYLIHDICHFVIEKKLNYESGFWGMLSKGYKFKELFGKENELTEELRFIEQIVGPIQSIYLDYFKKEDFKMLTSHIKFEIGEDILDECVTEIKNLTDDWTKLAVGDKLMLTW